MAIRLHIPLPGPFVWVPDRRPPRGSDPGELWVVAIGTGLLLLAQGDRQIGTAILLGTGIWAVATLIAWWTHRRE